MPDPRTIAEEELYRAAIQGDVLSPMERDIVGVTAARVHIPMKDTAGLLEAASVLRTLANDIEVLARRREETWRILLGVRFSVVRANRALKGNKR